MRIVQIGSYPLSCDCIKGGVEASVYGLAQEQSRTSEVHVFDAPRIGGNDITEKDGGVIVHRFCNTGQRQAASFRQVKTMAKEIGALHPDICHIHGTGMFSWLVYRRLKRMSMKIAVTVHGLALVEKRNLLKKNITVKRVLQYGYQGMVEMRLLSHVPMVIVDTDYVKEMVNAYPIRRKPVVQVIPQGINEDYYGIRCSEEPRALLSVGAIGERKGHLFTLQAFELARKMGVECKLCIVGTMADGMYYERLCDSIAKSEFRNDIELHVDVPDVVLRQMYASAHIFVLHTEEESQGIAFAEAMATGMPVVSTKVGGVPFVVDDRNTGLLSDYADVNAFADNIRLLMKNLQMWKDMSLAAQKKASHYSWSSIAKEVQNYYRQLG